MLVFHTIENVKIACWVSEGKSVTGLMELVFIHGSGADHRIWEKQYSELKNDFTIAAVDLPGHGLSEGSGERDVLRYVEWIRKLIAILGLKKPVLIGHSLGAAISLTYAIHHGEMVSGVVSVGGGVRMPVNPVILTGLRTDPSAIIALAAKFSVSKGNRERLSGAVTGGMSRVKPEVLYGDFLACDGLDISGEVARIGVPVLIVCGADDKMTPPALSRSLKEGIPFAQLTIIEGAGHMVMMENVDTFNDIIRTFVKSLPSA
ncbi:MAG: alpha/beta hydrolase [Deltaproteobacteria bacterium]|nr:alpha/beta hydrolase [Deltaproteobacteria bacterium]